MTRYYVAAERGVYIEVKAYSLDDVAEWMNRRIGNPKWVTDNRKSKFLANRKFGGLVELPMGYAEVTK